MNKYEGLTTRLNKVRSGEHEVILTLQEIENVCSEPLPSNAWLPTFWENPSNRPYIQGIKKAIRAAGFRAALIPGEGKVRFSRC
jgi:hypothetical protein